MDNKDIKYFLYARRSVEKSDKEEKVASIDSQISEMRQVADREGLRIVGTFQEAKSAKEPYVRKEFMRMIEQISKGKANGILCWKIDRLARNAIDEGTIKHFLQKGIVKNIKASDRDWYPDDNVLMASVEFGVATQYSRDLSKHIKRGMKARVEQGVRPGIAPIGYKNSKYHEKGKEEILIDEERFPLIRKVFDCMLTGKYTPFELVKISDELGLTMRYSKKNRKKISKSHIYRILTNPFYYGQFEFPEGSGNRYKGNHRPMITYQEFDQIQVLLGRKQVTRSQTKEFAYTGLIKCAECGAGITAEAKVKKQQNGNVHHYTYYHCTKRIDSNCSQKSVTEKEINLQIREYLQKIKIPESIHKWVVSAFREMYEQDLRTRGSLGDLNKKKLSDIQIKLDNLTDMRLNREITSDEFVRIKSGLEKDKLLVENQLTDISSHAESWFDKVSKALDFAKTSIQEFDNGDLNKRKAILASIGYNHQLKDRKLLIQPFKPFLIIEELSESINKPLNRLEPRRNLVLQGQNGEKTLNSAMMWRCRESNPGA